MQKFWERELNICIGIGIFWIILNILGVHFVIKTYELIKYTEFSNFDFIDFIVVIIGAISFLYLLKTWFSLLLAGIVIIAALFVGLFKKE
jgi:hypothetical protein